MVYDFCAEVAQRQCDFLIRCTTSGADGFRANGVVASSQRATCEANQRLDCQQAQASYGRGRTAVNLTALRVCLDAQYPSASCARDQNLVLTACDVSAYTTALTAPSALCAVDSECANGFCQVNNGATCGTCRAALNPDGGAFGNCNRDAQCSPTSYCRLGGAGGGTCTPRIGLDGGCTNTPSCAAGLICPEPLSPTRFCQVGKPEGASCVKGRLECARSGTDFELVCATQFTSDGGVDRCSKRFNTTPNGPCNTGEQVQGAGVPTAPACLDNEYCENGLCANKRSIGQPCGTNTEACVAGARCVQGICAALGDLGATCTQNGNNVECRSFLTCTGGMCQPSQSMVGGTCSNNNGPACVPVAYCPFTGGGMTPMCVALKNNGVTCMNSRECGGGDCNNGLCANICWR